MMPIPVYKMAQYRATMKKRLLEEQDEIALYYDRAWSVAIRAADMLRAQYGVQRVYAIGSLSDQQRFHKESDVDLVVCGLAEGKYYRAAGQLLYLDPRYEIDLIRIEDVSDSFKKEIEQEGIEL